MFANSSGGVTKQPSATMMNDQFGIGGLMVMLKCSSLMPTPDGISQTMVREMELLRNKAIAERKPLREYFPGPLVEQSEPKAFSEGEHQTDVPLCPEYLVTKNTISKMLDGPGITMNKLRERYSIKMDLYSVDLLFYIFYNFPRDILQLEAAGRLYAIGWRFHVGLKLWVRFVRCTEATYVSKDFFNSSRSRGIYNYFDCNIWKIMQREMDLDIMQFEGPPKAVPGVFVHENDLSFR